MVDTLRRDALPMYGGAARTPHLQQLAARGQVRDGLASFHMTSMAMGALFTGRTPSLETGDAAEPLEWLPSAACGMARFLGATQTEECLPPSLPTLGEAVRAQGYHTVGVVANPLLHDPAGFSRGFDRWEEVGGEAVRDAANFAVRPRRAAALRTWQRVNARVRASLADLPAAPLFLYVHYLDVHDWIIRKIDYRDAVEEMDRGIGDLLELLSSAGLLEGATILLTSDHGERMVAAAGEGPKVLGGLPLHFGNPSYREVLEVPLLLVEGEGVTVPRPARSEDLFYVLLDLAGAAVPDTPRDLGADELFVGEANFRTYRRGRFKSIQPRKGGLVLVDLEQDPGETRDVAALHPGVADAHRRRVDEISAALAASGSPGSGAPDEEWLDRLRSLGYVE